MTLRPLTVWYAGASLAFTAGGAYLGSRGDLGLAFACAVAASAYAVLALLAGRSTPP